MDEMQPSEYDLIVVGTGLQEALIAGCAAKAGKTVLHLDQADYYGSHWASLTSDEFLAWATSQQAATGSQQGQAAPACVPKTRPAEAANASPAASDQQRQPVQESHAQRDAAGLAAGTADAAASTGRGVPVDPPGRSITYSNVHLQQGRDCELGASREYNIDLAPKVLHCAGALTSLLVSCGAQNYMEFNHVQASYQWRDGRLRPVPASRADVFRDRTLSHLDKRLLMRFLNAAMEGIQGQGSLAQAFASDQPFVQLLSKEGLTAGLREIVMYAIALVDHDQEGLLALLQGAEQSSAAGAAGTAYAAPPTNSSADHTHERTDDSLAQTSTSAAQHPEAASSTAQGSAQGEEHAQPASRPSGPGAERGMGQLQHSPTTSAFNAAVTAAEGKARMSRYLESMGRYGVSTGAFLTPLYGCGELPQAFCRVAAVHGATYVLRQRVTGLVLSADGRTCEGGRVGSGQVLKCKALAAHADVLMGLLPPGWPQDCIMRTSRAVCILDSSLQEGESSLMAVMPPWALAGGNPHAIRVLQVGAATMVAPRNRYLLHLSTPSTAATAAADLQAAVEALVQPPCAEDNRDPAAPAHSSLSAPSRTGGEAPAQPSSAAANKLDPVLSDPSTLPAAGKGDAVSPAARFDLRPRALLVAYYNQATPAAADMDAMPANVACCAGPDHSADFSSAVQGAAAQYARLFPGDPGMLSLVGAGTGAGDDSDEEALEALDSALKSVATAVHAPEDPTSA